MSLDMQRFVSLIQKTAKETVDEGKPFSFCIGKVISPEPALRVQVSQKLVLGSNQLIRTNAVRDYYVKLTTCGETTGQADGTAHRTEESLRLPVAPEDYGAFDRHRHDYKGNKWWKVNLALKVGESVILLRADGGQKYIILDRVEAPTNV